MPPLQLIFSATYGTRFEPGMSTKPTTSLKSIAMPTRIGSPLRLSAHDAPASAARMASMSSECEPDVVGRVVVRRAIVGRRRATIAVAAGAFVVVAARSGHEREDREQATRYFHFMCPPWDR